MTKIKSFTITISLNIFLLFANRVFAADWAIRGLLPLGTGYYDKDSIKKINKNISQVWTVTVYNEE
jgi:hypothetical protein